MFRFEKRVTMSSLGASPFPFHLGSVSASSEQVASREKPLDVALLGTKQWLCSDFLVHGLDPFI